MLEQLGLIGTIRDEEDSPEEPDTESEQEDEPIVLNRKKKFGNRGAKDFNADFEFGERDGLNCDEDWVMADVMKQLKNKVEPAAEPVLLFNLNCSNLCFTTLFSASPPPFSLSSLRPS
ncbi:probable ATP-dependent RNA helicase DDX27 [Morone saxatilis]|uniref:probable ATP-dependent RNA helicase DDX27 n=1 Tax=Morone saxatilis TaxID=34816 RepID=UPI0015E1C7B3|nr:probable ATP-dependent RNA helicase DDX27 [Morone saxatilis]